MEEGYDNHYYFFAWVGFRVFEYEPTFKDSSMCRSKSIELINQIKELKWQYPSKNNNQNYPLKTKSYLNVKKAFEI